MTKRPRGMLAYAILVVAGILTLTAVRIWSLFVGDGPMAVAVPVMEGVVVFAIAASAAVVWLRRSGPRA